MHRKITAADIPADLKYQVMGYLLGVRDIHAAEALPLEEQIAEVLNFASSRDVVEPSNLEWLANYSLEWRAYEAVRERGVDSPEFTAAMEDCTAAAEKAPELFRWWLQAMLSEICTLHRAVQLGIATVCNLPPDGQRKAAMYAIREARSLQTADRENSCDEK